MGAVGAVGAVGTCSVLPSPISSARIPLSLREASASIQLRPSICAHNATEVMGRAEEPTPSVACKGCAAAQRQRASPIPEASFGYHLVVAHRPALDA